MTVKRATDAPPPPVISAPPERELERKLKRNPDDPDAKADVGSDESMDASDPSSATQPGQIDEPAPSSGFPENRSDSNGGVTKTPRRCKKSTIHSFPDARRISSLDAVTPL